MKKWKERLKATIKIIQLISLGLILIFSQSPLNACTGIRLIAKDGSVVYGRSMEWGAFDLHSRVTIVPRGIVYKVDIPEHGKGMSWVGKYGYVGLDYVGKKTIIDGINEKGLSIGGFYHPGGYCKYPDFNKKTAYKSMTIIEFLPYILSVAGDIEEAKKAINDVFVVNFKDDKFSETGMHLMITDAKGKSIVVEWPNGKVKIFDAPLGVITNAPSYDWHLTNLNNYLGLSQTPHSSKTISGINFKPVGAGSGFVGLPGDFTPPSRFIRAVAFTQTARKTPTSKETIYELFRILDNFNLGLGNAEGSDIATNNDDLMRSSTIWTTGYDLTNRIMYYHTQHNRRVRMIDLKKIDFSNIGNKIIYLPMDKKKEQDIEDITPKLNK